MSQGNVTIEILRYHPETCPEPRFGRFEVPFRKEWSILDALQHIKEELDGSVVYRWSCRMAVCGSCGMVINGTPKLACETFLRDFGPGSTITLEPLKNFAIERDLAVDLEDFVEKLERVKPYIVDAGAALKKPKHKSEPPKTGVGEFRQTPEELGVFKQFTMCINCLLCYSACPQFGLNPDFIGPAALALAHRYNADSRDLGVEDRKPILNEKDGVWTCTFVGYCSEVCPKHVDPAAAIQREKVNGLMDWGLSKLGGGH